MHTHAHTHAHTHTHTHTHAHTHTHTHIHSLPRSQAKAAIAYHYKDGGSDDEQAKRDEQLLAAYLGEDVEKEAAFSSESEYGRPLSQ